MRKISNRRRNLVYGAALVLSLGVAATQGVAQTPQALATNGDISDGKPVITKLTVDNLPLNSIHRMWFRVMTTGTGQHWDVPVVVIRGAKPGKRLLLNTGIHGDELNGTRILPEVLATIDPAKLSGTITAVLLANIPGALLDQRTILVQSSGPDFSANVNRVMPGKIDGTVTERYAARLWNDLYDGNADLVIDVHAQSSGTEYPMFVYFDQRLPDSRRMAERVGADAIKIDSGEKGSVETTFDEAKIPAITFEIGSPNVYQRKMIDRAVAGIRNVMFSYGMIADMPAAAAKPAFEGNEFTNVKAAVGGLAEITVKLGDMVTKDQPIAIQRDLFGDTLKQYNAPHDGYVLSVSTNPVREPGAMLVRVLWMNADPKCKDGC